MYHSIMDLIITRQNIYNTTPQEEMIIVYLDEQSQVKKLCLHFPSIRFCNYGDKLRHFTEKINGSLDQEDSSIIYTRANAYRIYDYFYNIFY